MKKRILAATLSLCMCLAMFAGCGKKVTVKEVLDGVNQTKMDSAHMDVIIDGDVSADVQGAPITAKANLNYAMDVVKGDSNVDIFMDVDMQYSLLAFSQAMKMQAYLTVNDDASDMYMKMDMLGDKWYHNSQTNPGVSIAEAITKSEEAQKEGIAEDAPIVKNSKLSEEKYDGVDCYKVVYSDNLASYYDQVVEAMASTPYSIEDVEEETGIVVKDVLEQIKFEYTIYANKKDFTPVYYKFDLSQTNINDLVSACGFNLEELTKSIGMPISSVELNSLAIEIKVKDINNVTVEVPEDVKNNAVDAATLTSF